MAPEKTLKRKVGGQPGNQNALKHGFYARSFSRVELDDLDVLKENYELSGLASEVALLRIRVRRMQENTRRAEEEGREVDWISTLNALGLACTRIAALLRAQKALYGDNADGISAIISQVLTEITQEWKLGE